MNKYNTSLELKIFTFLENFVLISFTGSFYDSINFVILGVCEKIHCAKHSHGF